MASSIRFDLDHILPTIQREAGQVLLNAIKEKLMEEAEKVVEEAALVLAKELQIRYDMQFDIRSNRPIVYLSVKGNPAIDVSQAAPSAKD